MFEVQLQRQVSRKSFINQLLILRVVEMSKAPAYVVDAFIDLTREERALPQSAISTAHNSQATTASEAPGDVANLQDFEEVASGSAGVNLGPAGPQEMLVLAAAVDIIAAAHQLEQAVVIGEAIVEAAEDVGVIAEAAVIVEAAEVVAPVAEVAAIVEAAEAVAAVAGAGNSPFRWPTPVDSSSSSSEVLNGPIIVDFVVIEEAADAAEGRMLELADVGFVRSRGLFCSSLNCPFSFRRLKLVDRLLAKFMTS